MNVAIPRDFALGDSALGDSALESGLMSMAEQVLIIEHRLPTSRLAVMIMAALVLLGAV